MLREPEAKLYFLDVRIQMKYCGQITIDMTGKFSDMLFHFQAGRESGFFMWLK